MRAVLNAPYLTGVGPAHTLLSDRGAHDVARGPYAMDSFAP
ncbi:hypothetical protein SXCC_01303 [Gluconacetobacter sp. SXCC-1]|nr:hypothetical protein SXCC_01303 [Gluconacetobacter sp. SXCC-1]